MPAGGQNDAAPDDRPQNYPTRRHPTRWWVARVVSVLVVAVGAGYALLPVWLPAEWLARRLVNDLSRELNRAVFIDRARLSWIEGVVFEGITIEDRPGSTEPVLAKIGSIRCGFTPIQTLFTGRVDELEIRDPELFLAVGKDGRLNVHDLGQRDAGQLPSHSYLVQGLRCHVSTSRGEEILRMGRLACRLDPATGSLRLLGDVRGQPVPAGSPPSRLRRLSIHAHLLVPRLKEGVKLGGDVSVQWNGLALTDLPLGLVPRLPIEQVDGTTTGRLDMSIRADLDIDFVLRIALNRVRLRQVDADPTVLLPDAEVQADGHWDPNTDELRISQLAYETPGLRFSQAPDTRKPGLRFDPKGPVAVAANIAGEVKDWSTLRRELPFLDRYLPPAAVELEGATTFGLTGSQSLKEYRLALQVNAAKTMLRLNRDGEIWLDVPSGLDKSLEVEVKAVPGETLAVSPQFKVTVGSLSLSAEATVTLPADVDAAHDSLPELAGWILPRLQAEAQVTCARMEQLAEILPPLREWNAWREAHGAVTAGIIMSPAGEATRLTLNGVVDRDSRLLLGEWLDKSAPAPLAVRIGLTVPHHEDGSICDPELEISSGGGLLSLVAGEAHLDARWQRTASPDEITQFDLAGLTAGLSGVAELSLRVEQVEELLSLWPACKQRFAVDADRGITGNGSIVLRARHASSDNTRDSRIEATVGGEALKVQWGDWLDKPAGMPANLRLAYRVHGQGPEIESLVSAVFASPPGTVEASWLGAGATPGQTDGDDEHIHVSIEAADLDRFTKLVPRLAAEVAKYDPEGGGVVRLDAGSIAGKVSGVLAIDATDAAFRMPERGGFAKPAGAAAGVTIAWKERAPSSNGRGRTWELDDGSASLAGWDIEHFSGQVAIEMPSDGISSFVEVLNSGDEPFAAARLTEATITLGGRGLWAEPLDRLHPALARWRSALHLAGTTEWELRLQADPKQFIAIGTIDATETSILLATASEALPEIRKEAGLPTNVSFDVASSRADADGSLNVLIRQADLSVDGNTLSLYGLLWPASATGDREGERRSRLQLLMHLDHPERLLSLCPGGWIDDLAGNAAVQVELLGSPATWEIGRTTCQFRGFKIDATEDRFRIDGTAVYDQGRLVLDQLNIDTPHVEGTIAGTLLREGKGLKGDVGISLARLDLPAAQERWQVWERRLGQHPDPEKQGEPPLAPFLSFLKESEIKATVWAGHLRVNLEPDEQKPPQMLLAEGATATVAIECGPVDISFHALADGGVVDGTLLSHTQVSEPKFHLQYVAYEIQPGPLVDGYLVRMFPGMVATGPVTLIDETYQRLLARPDEFNPEVGEGELIIHGGSVEGRAAPLWVTRVFPGLNLARFDFSYLHSWFRKQPNGRVYHQMIYQGSYYNLYMIGYSDADRRFEYEVGVDFLADFDSRYWADSGQGRIPLFIKTGILAEDGTLLDERVNYSSPQRVIETLLVKNNPAITAYYAVRKRVLGEK